MRDFLAVAAGGAIGATARYTVYLLTTRWLGSDFPYATLIVNVLGSFVMGALIEYMALVWSASQHARVFLAVGVSGGFTTFSSFSLDVVTLYERGKFELAGLYICASVALSVGGLFLGLRTVRRLLQPLL